MGPTLHKKLYSFLEKLVGTFFGIVLLPKSANSGIGDSNNNVRQANKMKYNDPVNIYPDINPYPFVYVYVYMYVCICIPFLLKPSMKSGSACSGFSVEMMPGIVSDYAEK